MLPDEVSTEGEFLERVPQLHMEYWDVNDWRKYPLFEPNKYLKLVFYEEVGVTRVESFSWATRI